MVSILSDGNASEIAARLLEAAGDQPDLVTIDTSGTRMGFSVPDEIAIRAGFMKAPKAPTKATPKPEAAPVSEGQADDAGAAPAAEAKPEPKKAPAKPTGASK